MSTRFTVIRPIDGNIIVFDRSTGVAKEIVDPGELDLWLHGLHGKSHAEFLKAFYPNGEAQPAR
jgi:hypothetical protein